MLSVIPLQSANSFLEIEKSSIAPLNETLSIKKTQKRHLSLAQLNASSSVLFCFFVFSNLQFPKESEREKLLITLVFPSSFTNLFFTQSMLTHLGLKFRTVKLINSILRKTTAKSRIHADSILCLCLGYWITQSTKVLFTGLFFHKIKYFLEAFCSDILLREFVSGQSIPHFLFFLFSL